MITRQILRIFLVFLALAGVARADVLANYSFTGSVRTSSDSDLFSTAGAIADGPGLTTGSLFDLTRGNPAPSLAIVSTEIDGSTQAAAIAANDYITFTLTPLTGFVLNLSSLSFDYANYSNDGTFPAEGFGLRSSVDNFSANIGAAVIANANSAGAFATSTLSLSGAAFQNLSGAVEFRLYFADATTDADRGALVDNIVINGTSALVPEPAIYMLFGVGALICVQRFRRPKQTK